MNDVSPTSERGADEMLQDTPRGRDRGHRIGLFFECAGERHYPAVWLTGPEYDGARANKTRSDEESDPRLADAIAHDADEARARFSEDLACAATARRTDWLTSVAGDVGDVIDRVRVPAYVIDRHGVIRWLNPAAIKLVGDVRGRQLTSVVAPEESRRAREIFTRNLVGPAAGSDNKAVVIGADGERVSVEVSAVPLREGGHVIGVFGLVKDIEQEEPPAPHPSLTPRQTQVLHLLERGRSTQQIAHELHLSIDTVRNHIRHLMRALNAHSRLEAVAIGRQEHLVLT
jgi:PAS domain S-box-containing protein